MDWKDLQTIVCNGIINEKKGRKFFVDYKTDARYSIKKRTSNTKLPWLSNVLRQSNFSQSGKK